MVNKPQSEPGNCAGFHKQCLLGRRKRREGEKREREERAEVERSKKRREEKGR